MSTNPTRPPQILVIVGTPLADSLNYALATTYVAAARAGGAHVNVIDLAHDPIPDHPRDRNQVRMPRDERDMPLDPDVARYVAAVEAADHLVFFFPQWWGGTPAALKAWIDRVLLSGFSYRYRARGKFWDRMLTGRTSRIVMTSDAPGWWTRLMYGDAPIRTLRKATLWYCGVRTVGVSRIGDVRHRSPEDLGKAVASMTRLGATDARRTPRTTLTESRVDDDLEHSGAR